MTVTSKYEYYFAAILAASTIAAASLEAAQDQEQRELHEGWGHNGGWANDGWGHSWSPESWSSSTSSSGKSGKSGGGSSGSGKSGKSGYGSFSSSIDSHDHGYGYGQHWGAPPPGWHGSWGVPKPESSWSSSSSSSSGKSGKSGGYISSSSSDSHDHGYGHGQHGHGQHWGGPPPPAGYGGWGGPPPHHGPSHWHGGWGKPGWWGSSSSSSSSGKSGKSGGRDSKGSKGSSSSSNTHGHGHGHTLGGPPAWHGGWGNPGWWEPSSLSSSSTSGKSGKSGGSKSGKYSKGSSSNSSKDHDGHWVWVGGGMHEHSHGWDNNGWSSTSTSTTTSSTSGKSGKSGGSGSSSGSGSGKSGKSGNASTPSSIDEEPTSDDANNWSGDGWVAPTDTENPVYSKGGEVAGWKSDGWSSDGHYRDDIAYVRSEVSRLIIESERELIPKFLRLGFHDCVGGCDGCIDMTNVDNKGLEEPIDAIYPIVKRFKDSYSRADIWAMATLVSADLSVINGRPHGYHFPFRFIGRDDCSGANAKGVGGPDVEMPSNDLTTHGLLHFFKKYFDFDEDETVTIMGVHSVAVANRHISGFGNKGKEEGWVFDAKSYELNNRYYSMLVGDEDDVQSAPEWHMELVHNEDGISSRYQWYHEKEGEEERPIMLNADMALVRDFSEHMHTDANGNEGAVTCSFKDESSGNGIEGEYDGYTRRRSLQQKKIVACPVASQTIEKMVEYKLDNEMFLYDFEKVLEKMVKNGYHKSS